MPFQLQTPVWTPTNHSPAILTRWKLQTIWKTITIKQRTKKTLIIITTIITKTKVRVPLKRIKAVVIVVILVMPALVVATWEAMKMRMTTTTMVLLRNDPASWREGSCTIQSPPVAVYFLIFQNLFLSLLLIVIILILMRVISLMSSLFF